MEAIRLILLLGGRFQFPALSLRQEVRSLASLLSREQEGFWVRKRLTEANALRRAHLEPGPSRKLWKVLVLPRGHALQCATRRLGEARFISVLGCRDGRPQGGLEL